MTSARFHGPLPPTPFACIPERHLHLHAHLPWRAVPGSAGERRDPRQPLESTIRRPMPGEGEDSYTPSPPRCNLQKTPARRSPKGALREGGTGGPSPAPTCRCAVRGTLALALRASAVPVGVAPRPGRRRAGASPRGERPAGRRTVPAQHLRSGHSVPVPVGQVCPIGRSRGPNGVRPKGLQLEGHAPFWLRFILRLSGSGPG